MSGKLGSTDKIIMRTRNGRTHAYVVKHPYKGPLAPSRQKAVSSFAEAVKKTSVIMNTPELRSKWEEKYADYRKKADRYPNTYPNPYTTLRGFIIGSLVKVWPWSNAEAIVLSQFPELAADDTLAGAALPAETVEMYMETADPHIAGAVIFAIIGFTLVSGIEIVGRMISRRKTA